MSQKTEFPFSDPEINEVLNAFVDGTTSILADNFIGAWLQGSSATGGFDEHSDLDFVIGVERDLSKRELHALQAFHPYLYAHPSPWSQHLEGSYFPRDILAEYRLSRQKIWYLDHGRQKLERSSHDNTIVVKWILREKGVVLAGPHPDKIIDPIPVSELRLDIYHTFARWGNTIIENPEEIGSHFYQTFAVLSYCRMLHDLTEGDIHSKRAGAEWVKAQWDPDWHDLIDRAWSGRPQPMQSARRPADPDDLRRTVRFIQSALVEAQEIVKSYGLEPEVELDAA